MNKNILKKFTLWVVATIASMSLIVASIYNSPKEIISGEEEDDDRNRITLAEKKKEEKKLSTRIIEKIPLWFKVSIMIPMWLLGTLLLKLLEPLKGLLISVLLTFIILAIIVFVIAKLLFPNLKFKDIFNKRTLICLLVASTLIPVMNLVLSLTIEDYRQYQMLADFVVGIVLLIVTLIPLIRLKRKIDSIILPKENETEIQ